MQDPISQKPASPRPLTRRSFFGLAAAFAAGLALLGPRTTGAGRIVPRRHPRAGSKNAPGDAMKSVLGIEKDKADTAKLGETLRKYELPQPTEPAFVFQPLPAARGRR